MALEADATGIRIFPREKILNYQPRQVWLGRFDQYNRVTLPERLLSIAGIHSLIEVVVMEDNTLLLKPIKVVCALCGNTEELREYPNSKFLCEKCVQLVVEEMKEMTQ